MTTCKEITRGLWRRILDHKFLLIALLLSIIISVVYIESYEINELFGDEPFHIEITHREAAEQISPLLSILPGFLRFDWVPPLQYSVHSFFAIDSLTAHYNGENRLADQALLIETRRFMVSLAYFRFFLLVAGGILVYLIGIALGLSNAFAATAVALTVLNPRLLFFVNAMWPELLHFVLLLAAVYTFIAYLKGMSAYLLLLSSILFVYCTFTKMFVTYYFYLLFILLVYYHRDRITRKSTIFALGLFLIPFLTISTIQKGVNYYHHNIYAIATNKWVNIEKGIIPHQVAYEAGFKNMQAMYNAVSDDLLIREAASRERIIEYLTNVTSPVGFVKHQTSQFLTWLPRSFLLRAIYKNRWDHLNFLMTAAHISRYLSWFLMVIGSIGVFLYAWKNIVNFTAALFVFYYLAVLFIVFYNPRYFIPLIPFLAIFASLVLEDLVKTGEKAAPIPG